MTYKRVEISTIADFTAAIKEVKTLDEAKAVLWRSSVQAIRGYCVRHYDHYEKSEIKKMFPKELFDLVLEEVEIDLGYQAKMAQEAEEVATSSDADYAEGVELANQFVKGEISKESLLQIVELNHDRTFFLNGMAFGFGYLGGWTAEEYLSSIKKFIEEYKEVEQFSSLSTVEQYDYLKTVDRKTQDWLTWNMPTEKWNALHNYMMLQEQAEQEPDYHEGMKLAGQFLKSEINKDSLLQYIEDNQHKAFLIMGMAQGFGYREDLSTEESLLIAKRFIEEYAQELDDSEISEGQDLANEFLRHEISGQEFCQTLREKFTKAFLIGICQVFELDTEDCDVDELSRMVHEYVDMSFEKIPRTTYPPHESDASEKICNSTYKKRLRNFTEIKEVI